MKWKVKREPQLGDVRVIKRFAFFPTKFNGYVYWLERYQVAQTYIRYSETIYCAYDGMAHELQYPAWVDDRNQPNFNI